MARYQRRDPLLAYNFQVALMDSKDDEGPRLGTIALSTGGLKTMAAFSEVSGLEMTMEVEEYASGGINDHTLKFPGRIKWSNLILRRGMLAKRDPIDGSDLWTWHQGFLDGRGVRKDGLIILCDEQRRPRLTWSFHRGLPLKWTGPQMNAGQSQVAVEAIEIAHEGLTIVKAGGDLGQAVAGVVDAIF